MESMSKQSPLKSSLIIAKSSKFRPPILRLRATFSQNNQTVCNNPNGTINTFGLSPLQRHETLPTKCPDKRYCTLYIDMQVDIYEQLVWLFYMVSTRNELGNLHYSVTARVLSVRSFNFLRIRKYFADSLQFLG